MGKIVGIAGVGRERAEPDPVRGELQMIHVSHEAWGRGVAKRLLGGAEDELRDMGFQEAVLWVLESTLGRGGSTNGRAGRPTAL